MTATYTIIDHVREDERFTEVDAEFLFDFLFGADVFDLNNEPDPATRSDLCKAIEQTVTSALTPGVRQVYDSILNITIIKEATNV